MSEPDDEAIFADLDRESKEFDKDAEIDRILKAFRLNAYAVLELQPGVPDSDIKVCYRKKSLLIHPDKTKNPAAPDAFDRLKKAQTALLDEKERERLDEAIADARMLLIREHKWTVDSPELRSDEFIKKEWPEKSKAVLIDNEMRRRKQMKAQMQEEGRQQKKEDEELENRKRKREHEVKWEETREKRIGSWRDFQKGKVPAAAPAGGDGDGGGAAVAGAAGDGGDKKKKKKPKLKVLG